MTTWVLMAGLPGTGKSTLVAALEGRLSASRRVAVLDKDRIRAAIFPGEWTDYTREQDDLCVRAMIDAAAYLTKHGRADYILFDGRIFSRQQQIEELLAACGQAGAEWRILHLTCRDEVAEARLSKAAPAHPAQNRDASLYRKLKREFEPVTVRKLEVETSNGIEAQLDFICEYIQGPAQP